ncbi:Mu-like prophage major head subunit gpT family protein, partial [Candidatus Pacearchaeota archaeon]|nr:Mu-like prophage major head subunit gpT family protein [Candidatus Pacearchaeota archaeon]
YEGASWIDRVARLFNSDQESETYRWLGMSPAMREWIGGRQAKGFRENGVTIINKKFEATLEILVDWIRRDKTGQINIRIDELVVRCVEHWTKLLSTFIANGTGATSGLCYDGQYFFDSDHSEGDSGTQLNLLAAAQVAALDVTAPTKPTPSEAVAAILGVIAYMLGYKDDQGEPMNANAREFLVMTSANLWPYLTPAVMAENITGGETNVILTLKKDNFTVRLACNPRLTYTTQFVTFRTDAPTKALIRQEEEKISVSAKAEGSDYAFDNDAHQYGVKAIRNVGYGRWQYASHATLS